MKIRAYREEDSIGISLLMKDCFLNVENVARSFEPDYFQWKYRKNAFGKPVVWVAEDEGKIISYFAILPRRFWLNGQDVFAGQHLDAFMHPDYQGKGFFRDIIKNAFDETYEQGMEIILGSPNKPTVNLWLKKYAFHFCFEYRSLVRPLHFDSIIKSRLPIPILNKILGAPFNLFYRFFFRKKNIRIKIAFEKIEKTDPRIDQAWEQNKNSYTFTYTKDSDYLKWRFVDNPESYLMYLIQRDTKTIGYFVVKFTEIKKFQIVHLIDFVVPGDDEKTMLAALDGIIGLMKKQGADMMSCWALLKSPFNKTLKKFGFIERKKEYFFVMKSNKKGIVIPENINDVSLWSFSQGDTDEI